MLLAGLAASCVAFPVLYAGVVPERRPEWDGLPLPPDTTYRLLVVDWGYHTAIIVEQPRGWRLGPPGAESARFVEYAWGDRGFYRDSDYRPHRLAAALVAPTESVLYLDGHPDLSRVVRAEAVFTTTASAPTLRALVRDLERSVVRAADGSRSPSESVPPFRGRFYPAHGAYLWTRDCNWWTVARLASVGLAGSPTGVVFTPQVPGRLRGFAEM